MAHINQDLLRPDGEDNYGGVSSEHIYYTYLRDILTFPKTNPNATSYKEVGTITEDFVFRAGGKWNKFEAIPETISIDSNPVGERAGRSYENKAQLDFAKITPEAIGFMRKNANSGMVWLMMDNNGFWRIMGDRRIAAEISEGAATIGKKVADLNKASFTIKSQFEPPPVYAGTLPDGTKPVYP